MLSLEKLFYIKKENTYTIYKFLGITIKTSGFIDFLQVINFQKNITKDKTILIIEPNKCHYETILGYYKYLKDLGFNVEVLTLGKSGNIFLNSTLDIKAWECNKKTFDFIFKYANFKKYYCLLFNSKRVYWGKCLNSTDGCDITDCYKKIPKGQIENIYVQHHIDFWNDCKKEKQIALANPTKADDLKKCIVNPHYFGDVKITEKNRKKIKFITVGGLGKERRNANLLINAVKELHNNNISNFEIIVISSDKLENLPTEICRYFKFLGKVDFPTLFRAMEDADYFLPLLDPEVKQHQRYIKHGTSGSFQLIYGFLKPCIIHKTFADIYGFSEEDSFVYEKNSDLYKCMLNAIDLTQKEYTTKQSYLKQIVKNINEISLKNLEILAR